MAFKIPCHNSVINWTLRYGHHLFSNVEKLAEAWFAVVDMSIETGLGKALVVLRVPLSVWARKDHEALTLEDCEAVGVDVRTDWNAETVKASLEAIFEKAGTPAFIIKDQGGDITAGVRLLGLPDVHDIGHKTANALKGRFAKDKWFIAFTALIAAFGAKLRQSRWAYLTPPKIRSKGRFQSIARVVDWAQRLLAFFGEAGNEVPDTIGTLLGKLQLLRAPLERLAKLCLLTNRIQAILKNDGLDEASNTAVRELLKQFSTHCPVKHRLILWLDRHIEMLATLRVSHPSLTRLPVSSDVLESLFGRFKHVLARQPRPELGQMTAVLATLCGRHSSAMITEALSLTRTRDLEVLRGNHLPHSVEIKRREFRKKTAATSTSDAKKCGTTRLAG